MAAGGFGVVMGPDQTTSVPITPASGQGPYADVVPPTLSVVVQGGKVLVGATDPQSGIKAGSLSIKASVSVQGRAAGAELADLAQHDAVSSVWTLPAVLAVGDQLTVSVRDNQRALDRHGKLWSEDGNVTRIVKTVRSLAQPEAPPIAGDEQSQFLRDQIASLQSQVSALQAEQTANRNVIASLQGKLQGLKTAWEALQSALEE
jgi:hypothetical protein